MNKEGQRLLDSVSESYGTEPPETFVDAPAPGWKTIVLATYYTLVVCLGGVQFGVMAVFSSPLLDDFHQTHVPTNFTVWSGFNQCVYQYLIAPIGPAGAVFGSILSSPVVAVTGFVTGLVVMSSLFVSGWLLMAASHFTYHGGTWSVVWFRTLLLLGRLLTGVGAGWAAGVVPVYIGEVAPHKVRGKLGALFQLFICSGILFVYFLGSYIPYWQLAFVFTGVSVVQLVLMFTIRESPRLSHNPLKNIRERRRKAVTRKSNTRTMSELEAPVKSNFLRIAVFAIIMVLRQFIGVSVIISFAGPIFHAARLDDKGGVSSGLLASLTVGVVQVVFMPLSLMVIDCFGRRIPLFFGGLALMVANVGMTVYFADAFGFVFSPSSGNSSMGHRNDSIQNCISVPMEPSSLARHLSPLPIASVCLFFAAFSLSWGPVPWVLGGELFPKQVRELGMGISAAIGWTCMVIVMTAFPIVSESIGQAIPFLVLSVVSLLSSIFVALFIAETKGLPLDQISSMKVTNVRKNVKEFGLLLGWFFRCGFVRKMDMPHQQN